MATPAIVADRVTKHFPKSGRMGWRVVLGGLRPDERFTAVNRVSLEVPRGEVVGILGRNGAGKSTLLRVLGGIYAADEGRISMSGDLAGLFELGGFGNSQLTGREFCRRYLQLFGVPAKRWKDVTSDIHQFSELGAYFDEKILTYSAGMSARLFFSAATALPHEIYLIDELLSVGDAHFQAKSWARIRERLATGASGLLVTHDWASVIKLCRHSKVLQSGQVWLDGRSDEVIARYLDLPKPPAKQARLLVTDGQVFAAVAGEDMALAFDVEVNAPVPVEVAASVEALQLGIGWEAVLLTEFQPLAQQPGRYAARLHVPSLPLAPGDYSLNLFLSREDGSGERQAIDARSWTYGNGLTLRVTGTSDPGIAPFPLEWSVEAT